MLIDAATLADELVAAGFDMVVEIGRGTYGIVFRCVEPDLERFVAVKVLTLSRDSDEGARFVREQHAMSRLSSHPSVVEILRVGVTHENHPYIVMPYYSEGSLENLIQSSGRLTVPSGLHIAASITRALAAAHRLGIVHRDVKPANVLVGDTGAAVLGDFGIAHIPGGFVTGTDTITGSPAFTAPEVLAGYPATSAADVYSLGGTVFAALTGHVLFQRRSGEKLFTQFVRIAARTASELAEADLPTDVSDIIENAMADSPSDRPTTDELVELLVESAEAHDTHTVAAPRHAQNTNTNTTRVEATVGNFLTRNAAFVGRKIEMREAEHAFGRCRLLTLAGPGGVGKTTLATQLASRNRDNFKDGTWMVELGEQRDPSLLFPMVATALRLSGRRTAHLDDIIDHLYERNLLLVIDNCEHMVGDVAIFLDAVLKRAPGVHILATSREPLNLADEQILRVLPMTLPDSDAATTLKDLTHYDAVALFLDRARTAAPGFELTVDNQDDVVDICQQLEGIPLAIELAAARLATLSPHQLAHRLSDRFSLLNHGYRNLPDRQRTLRMCIDWSYDLCTPVERVLWHRVSVFANEFELDAVEGICGTGMTPSQILDTLDSLVEKSIILRGQSGSTVTFRLLVMVRDYGRTPADESSEFLETVPLRDTWYQALVERANDSWIGPQQLSWLDRLERELPNLREILQNCITNPEPDGTRLGLQIASGLFNYWTSRGQPAEGRTWLRHLLRSNECSSTYEVARGLASASILAELQGDLDEGERLVSQGMRLLDQTADRRAWAVINHADGLTALFSGDLGRATMRLESSSVYFGHSGEVARQVESLELLGLSAELLGESEKAITSFEQAVEITERAGECVYRSYSLWGIAISVWRQGDWRRAQILLKDALSLSYQAEHQIAAAVELEGMAWITADEDAERAAILLGSAQSLGLNSGCSASFIPSLFDCHDSCADTVRQTLGTREAAAAIRYGRSLNFSEAIRYALHNLKPKIDIQVNDRPIGWYRPIET
ncbi:protein kinase [Rhodococcus ruber]|uniref:Protein kinase n=1 Tax=Rhodococcus ruber TaxID=1830 RepID=A0ABT4MGD8_9NOCA|nr:protein kinase [Rhodococcus ruber]MCZ4519490.1 protein kinase [Rhodococcus ruber]